MKILFVHNRYKHLGGEDTVLDAEMGMMSHEGHEVSLAHQENSAINSYISKAKAFIDVTYSGKYKKWMSEQIRVNTPDVVHIHNLFPLLSPSIYDACQESNVPVVQTLHNYRTICPGALLMREGNVCEECVEGTPYRAVFHRCYRGSVIGSLAVARMVNRHRAQGTWNSKVNRFIALTEFARSKFIEAGFRPDKIVVKPNFTNDDYAKSDCSHGDSGGALFVGRLSDEKGVSTLLRAWDELEIPLRIAGTGPLEEKLFNSNDDTIVALGKLDKVAVRREMTQAAFLVMPSEWYEGFPMVLVEAFSLGLPVVASCLGGMAEIVEDDVTGLHFEAGNARDLADKVLWMSEHPEECQQMGRNARKVYEQKYVPDVNCKILMDIYQQAINDANSHY